MVSPHDAESTQRPPSEKFKNKPSMWKKILQLLKLANNDKHSKMDTPKTAQNVAFIIVDVQNDFMPDGSLPIEVPYPPGESALTATSNKPRIENFCVQLINSAQRFKAAGATIVVTRDWHPHDHPSFKARGGIWPVHCVQNSKGSEYAHEDLAKIYDIEILKGISHRGNGYSGFGDLLDTNVSLLLELHNRKIDTLVVCGVATDYCVKSTAVDGKKARRRDIERTKAQQTIVLDKFKELPSDRQRVDALKPEEAEQLWKKFQNIKVEEGGDEDVFKAVYLVTDMSHGVETDEKALSSVSEACSEANVEVSKLTFKEITEILRVA